MVALKIFPGALMKIFNFKEMEISPRHPRTFYHLSPIVELPNNLDFTQVKE